MNTETKPDIIENLLESKSHTTMDKKFSKDLLQKLNTDYDQRFGNRNWFRSHLMLLSAVGVILVPSLLLLVLVISGTLGISGPRSQNTTGLGSSSTATQSSSSSAAGSSSSAAGSTSSTTNSGASDQKINDDMSSFDNSMSKLNGENSSVDQGLNDQQTDLSY